MFKTYEQLYRVLSPFIKIGQNTMWALERILWLLMRYFGNVVKVKTPKNEVYYLFKI